MRLPEDRQLFRRYQRIVERRLIRDRPKLFRALEEFANMRSDQAGWRGFRKRCPDFFPEHEYDRAMQGLEPSILGYPYWLHQIWVGGETVPALHIMLGVDTAPTEGTPEDAWYSDLATIHSKFLADWGEGVFCYEGACDFQRALYLLFRESWRARVCEQCDAKFIAKRKAQKYCSSDCSENIQRELKRKWWAEHGETWRQRRKAGKHGSRKARSVVAYTLLC